MINKLSKSENYQELSDLELWNLFLQGDDKAYEFIYFHFIHDIYNYGITICANKNLLKDLVQDLFLEIWNSRNSLSATDNIKFYLFKALKYKVHHALKAEQKNNDQQKLIDELQWDLSIEDKMIMKQVAEEKKTKLLRAYHKLPHRQKEVLNLIYFENMSYDQVSELMDINVSSVYTLTWKAISALKKNLINR
jgi:RNA polymerase sigma factor (sigma-70 family)